MSIELIINDLTELDIAANAIINSFPDHRTFAFYGEMGVGKTTLIKLICEKLGVKDITNSPTFSIINEYITVNKEQIYHFDLYRLNSETELFDIGAEEYLNEKNWCFIEWPEIAKNILPLNMVNVNISEKNGIRNICISKSL